MRTATAQAKRLIVFGFVLMGVGLALTVLKLGFDVRAIGEWNIAFAFFGAGASAVGARRRRQEVARWAPPAPADRYHH